MSFAHAFLLLDRIIRRRKEKKGLTFVRAGFTRRIVGLPKAESDAVLRLLFYQLSENPDFQVRFHWEPNSIAIWDNRVRKTTSIRASLPLTQGVCPAFPLFAENGMFSLT